MEEQEQEPQADVDMPGLADDDSNTTTITDSESDTKDAASPDPELLPLDYAYPVNIPPTTARISCSTYPASCRLPPELLSRCFLFLDDRSSQAVSLRICKWLYLNSDPASNLYNIVHAKANGGSHSLTGWTTGLVDSREDTSANNLVPLNTKLDLLRHTTCLVISEHMGKSRSGALRCDPQHTPILSRIPLPKLRVVTFRCNGFGNFCSASDRCCGLIRDLIPKKLVFRDMCGPIPSLPRSTETDNRLPEGIEEIVLVLDPKHGFNVWGEPTSTFDHPPTTLKKVTILFNTEPGEEWTAHKTNLDMDDERDDEDEDAPHAGWLNHIADEIAIITTAGNWDMAIINASSALHTELGFAQPDPFKVDKAMRGKVKGNIEHRLILKTGPSLKRDMHKDQVVLERVRFISMEEFISRGEDWVGVLEADEVRRWWRVLDAREADVVCMGSAMKMSGHAETVAPDIIIDSENNLNGTIDEGPGVVKQNITQATGLERSADHDNGSSVGGENLSATQITEIIENTTAEASHAQHHIEDFGQPNATGQGIESVVDAEVGMEVDYTTVVTHEQATEHGPSSQATIAPYPVSPRLHPLTLVPEYSVSAPARV